MTHRILAKDISVSNDTRATGNNNNDLIIGPSSAGKTRGYVIPNLLQSNESMIVADTKGNLCRQFKPYLESKGFQVVELNFADMGQNAWGYNPLTLIRRNRDGTSYNQQDILAVSTLIVPVKTHRDPYWEQSAQVYLQALIGYTLSCLPETEQDLVTVSQLSQLIGSPVLDQLFRELCELDPDNFAVARYRTIKNTMAADRTDACIRSFLDNAILSLTYSEARTFFHAQHQLCFDDIGNRKTAVFLTISDTDRSNDRLVNLFYAQALQYLVDLADHSPGCRLPVPVRFILDDFATNTLIPDFDNIISVIRSREISVSLVIQSLSQLEGLYGRAKSQTIMNNCDNWLYLGGLDLQTAQEISIRLNRTVQTVLNMPHSEVLVLTRGQAPRRCQKCLPEEHPYYQAALQSREATEKQHRERSTVYETAV